jgi:FixJ family two-component response regulator
MVPCDARIYSHLNGEGRVTRTRVFAVIDDDAAVRRAVGRLILSFGFTVEVFGSGEEFFLYGNPEGISCIVLDFHMSGMSGLDVQSHLAASGYNIPIIFITACRDEQVRVRALAAGAVDFLHKPFSDEVLLSGIRSALKLSDQDGLTIWDYTEDEPGEK